MPDPILPTDPSGAGFVSPSLFPSPSPTPSPTPSPSVTPAYDGGVRDWSFLNTTPSEAFARWLSTRPDMAASLFPSDNNYPVPGEGDTTPPPETRPPNLVSRVVNNIPAVRLARFLAGLVQGRGQTWQQNAASHVPVQPALSANATVFGYNPSGGGGGGTSRYNYGTQSYSPTPSTNPLYNSGAAGWQPVGGADVGTRWLPNSGTGNFQADQTTKAFEAGGGYPGTPNRTTVTDRGIDRFRVLLGPGGTSSNVRRYSPETGYSSVNMAGNPQQSAFSRDLYQQALAAVPMNPTTGYDAQYIQQVNDWIRAHQNQASALPVGTISGQPILPGGA